MAYNENISNRAQELAEEAARLAQDAATMQQQSGGVDPFIFGLTVFVLACFVGYYVVWKVTPALHTPLMAVTNAISGIIIIGAIIALGPEAGGEFSHTVGFIAVVIASINIFGGFIVTQRMLGMFQKKPPSTQEEK
ncbi:MAG: NAD(P) transhydrogenase subunit alpha [Rickettsiales bacterium]